MLASLSDSLNETDNEFEILSDFAILVDSDSLAD